MSAPSVSPLLGDPAARDWEFPRAVAGVALLVRYAGAHGVPASSALAGSGLGVGDLGVADREVTAAQELTVVRNLQRHCGTGAGAAVGATYRAETFGIFGYALLASRTVLDAMDVALRFIDLSFTFALPRATLVGDRVVVHVDGAALPDDVRAFLVARDAAAIGAVLDELVPGGVGATMRIGAREAVLEFRAAELDRPLPAGDQRSRVLAERLCAETVTRRRARTGLAQEVRVLITQHLSRGAPMGEVAAALGRTERTLRRHLAECETSYQELLDEVRASLACSLLGGRSTISVAEVARRVGYAEASSFILAFRRWTGQTPAAYARAAR
ncbi:helix-turn-helix domain-containing protein [Nocardioides ochotonae]|uniref:helix-turn-helix domain-containing protein n=1 Tax=Nocardioides ochotonae TaxID=2685869 RepID=UPI00140D9F46|nr:AraC family transcriptional regulator [Nocardioides ochotonae]